MDKSNDIKVGDELISKYNADRAVVLRYNSKYDGNKVVVMYADGSSGKINKENYEKTGRTFPQITGVLHQMIER